jgi:cobalamin biosynthesis protein CbiG
MVVVGLTATKEATTDNIVQAVDVALEKVHVPLSRVNAIATIDAQGDSQPLMEAATKLHTQLEFLDNEKIPTATGTDSLEASSNQEKSSINALSERAALFLAGPNAKLILKKTKLEGVIIAIAEAE